MGLFPKILIILTSEWRLTQFSYMGTGCRWLSFDPQRGSKLFQRKTTKKVEFALPLHDPGNHNVPWWKISMQKCIKGKFTLSLLDPWTTSLRLEKKISPRNAQNEVFRKSLLTHPHPLDPLGVLPCPSMRGVRAEPIPPIGPTLPTYGGEPYSESVSILKQRFIWIHYRKFP